MYAFIKRGLGILLITLLMHSWGESAGAWSVGLHHVINNGIQGQLFRGGIMVCRRGVPNKKLPSLIYCDQESGAPRTLPSITSNQPLFDQLVADIGCKEGANAIECLRTAPYDNLTAAINRTPDLFSFNSLQILWAPSIDGVVITRDPMISIQKGLISKVCMGALNHGPCRERALD